MSKTKSGPKSRPKSRPKTERKSIQARAVDALVENCVVDDSEVILSVADSDSRGVALATSPEHGDLSICVVEEGEATRTVYLTPEAVALVRAALSLSKPKGDSTH